MIHLERITGKNVWEILKLQVREDQRKFVASNETSIIEAYIAQNAHGHAFPFGIYADDIPVGFCMIGYGTDDSWTDAPAIARDSYNLWRLMIDAHFQGRGYGKAAMEQILSFIRTMPVEPATRCWLSYEPENHAARQLYRSFGFQETGDWDGEEMIAVLDLTSRPALPAPPEGPETSAGIPCETVPSVCRTSPMADKIRLFMDLFRGRADVYARRWENETKGTAGYSPACKNDGVWGICHKPCKTCNAADCLPFTPEAVEKHLAKDNPTVLGIYALQPDDTCWFLAIDMDEGTWQTDVKAIRSVCRTEEIPLAVERSRSGNGAHLWFFFSEKLPASLARRFGASLISAAMKADAKLSFSSYDRMFPNQDFMPSGGFGNLIALPLQPEAARKCRGSLFIDENEAVYPDQWLYLSQIRKMSKSEVDSVLAHIGSRPLGQLAESEEEEDKAPWNKAGSGIPKNDPTTCLECTLADRIYISTGNVSNAVQNQLKRLAAFQNPEFYKQQAMRMSVWNIPRVISCAEYEGNYLCLPRGCSEAVNAFAGEHHLSITWQDRQSSGRPISLTFKGTLRPEQQPALDALCQFD
ncbi:MAG: GNAT family N-acetyltransferase, partial [Clostridia bacterium]|nr:GNAT family N-acetyltransferase [Clostridia bacterium]